MITLKAKISAFKTHLIARHFSGFASDTCKLLMAEFEKVGYGQADYTMREVVCSWINSSTAWADKYVLAVALEKDTEERVRGMVLQHITYGGKEENKFIVGGAVSGTSYNAAVFNQSAGTNGPLSSTKNMEAYKNSSALAEVKSMPMDLGAVGLSEAKAASGRGY